MTTYIRTFNVMSRAYPVCDIQFVCPSGGALIDKEGCGQFAVSKSSSAPPSAPSTIGGQPVAGSSGAEGKTTLSSSRRNQKAKVSAAEHPSGSDASLGSSMPPSLGTSRGPTTGGGGVAASVRSDVGPPPSV